MQYVMEGGSCCFLPDNDYESRLVFEQIRAKILGFLPFAADRDGEYHAQGRDGIWYPWPICFPWCRPSKQDIPFVLILEFALPVTFYEAGHLLVKFSERWGKPEDRLDLRHLHQRFVGATLKRGALAGEGILAAIAGISEVTGRK